MKMRLLAVCVASCLCAVAEEEFTLKSSLSGTDFDWSQDSSYEGDAAPSAAGAYVRIPNGMVAKLSAADTASWTFVTNKVARIRPMGMTSRLVVDVAPANSPALLLCEVTYTGENTGVNYDRGGMEKTGDGELRLGATDKYAYFTTITISEGAVSLFDAGTEDKYFFDTFNVATNATLNLVGTTAKDASVTVCRKFFGEGTINCRNGALQTISSNTLTSEFSGRFTGTSKRMLTVCSPIILSGTNSTASGNTDLNTAGPLYVKSFGRYATDKTESSSLGVNGAILLENNKSGVVYIGDGETTDIEISQRSSSGTNFIDAGATGGLVLSAVKISMGSTSAAMHHAFAIQGSNTTESVFACRMTERYDTNAPANYCPYHIIKRGTGTWRMAHVSNTMLSGGISVEEGTLKYDTIAAAGTRCSLGFATNLYEAYTGTIDESRRVNWAISLGTAEGTEGAIEYSGADDVQCTTRPIALKGNGRIRQNVEKKFQFYGISSDGENAKTLTLDGSGTGGNEITGISDAGAGAISVAKEGTGTWTLTASNSFRGSLSVNAGTLNVCAPNWNWFKFTVMQSCTNGIAATRDFKLSELSFFDDEGESVTTNRMNFTENWRTVGPGEFSYAKDATVEDRGYPWNNLFDGTGNYALMRLPSAPTYNNESTWLPLVVRLPEDANVVESFDVLYTVSGTGTTRNMQPEDFKIEGSLDGVLWHELFVTNGVISPGSTKWLSKLSSWANHKAFTLEAPAASIPGPLDSASSVFVSANGTLRSLYGVNTLRSFGIDMATGGGTVDGFAFAENGTLTVVNAPREGATASFTPENCTGVANLSNWTLFINGNETSKFTVSATDEGSVRLIPIGFRLIIR